MSHAIRRLGSLTFCGAVALCVAGACTASDPTSGQNASALGTDDPGGCGPPPVVGCPVRTANFQFTADHADWSPGDPVCDPGDCGPPGEEPDIDPVALGILHAANNASYGNTVLHYVDWLCGTGLTLDEDPENENLLRNCTLGDEMPFVFGERPPPLDPDALKKHNKESGEELESSETWKKLRNDPAWVLDHEVEVTKGTKIDIQRGITNSTEIKAGIGAETLFVKAGIDASASYSVATDTTKNIDSEVTFKIWMYRKGPAGAPKEVKVLISNKDPVTAKFTLRDYELKATDVKTQLEAVAGGRYSVFKAEVSAKNDSAFSDKTTIEGYTTVQHTWTKEQAVGSFDELNPCLEDKIYFNGATPSMGQATGYAIQCMLQILNSLTDPNGKRVRYYGNTLTKGKECNLSCRVQLYPTFAFTDTEWSAPGNKGFRRYSKFAPDGNKSKNASKLWVDTGITISKDGTLDSDCKPDSIPGRTAYKTLVDSLADPKELKKETLGDDELQCTYYTTYVVRPSGWKEWIIPVFKDQSAWMDDPKLFPIGQPQLARRKLSRLEFAQLTTELIASKTFKRDDDGAWPDLKMVCDLLWEKSKGKDPQKWADAPSFTIPFSFLKPKPPPEGSPGTPVDLVGLFGKLDPTIGYDEQWRGYDPWKAAEAPFNQCQTVDAFGTIRKAP